MSFGAVERLMALRYLGSRRREGFISVIAWFSLLGIALGVATLIIVMSVMNGFRAELLGRILGANGHLTVYSNDGPFEGYADLAERLAQLEGVELVVPQIQAQVIVTVGEQARGGVVRALRPEDLLERELISGNIERGDIAGYTAGEGVLVGTRLARAFRVGAGQEITVLSPQSTTTVIGSVPRMKSYPIAAEFEIGMFEYDSSFIYVPLELAQIFFRMKNQVNAIEVFVEDPDAVRDVNTAIRANLGRGWRVVDWQQANSSFFNAVKVERNVMFLILSLIILVAAFNILSGQYMLVKGKGRDIAILRTMGASRGAILRVFFMSGAAIGLIGTALGVGIGIVFTDNIKTIQGWVEDLTRTQVFNPEIYFLTNLPAVRDPVEVLQVVAMALGISLLAPLLPAWQAARLDPVEALRYE